MAAGGRGTAQPKRDRAGFYANPTGIGDKKLISVTTTLKIIPKPALVHWAASEVAHSAIENAPGLARMRGRSDREAMYDHLRKAAEAKRDKAANIGTAFHDAIEAVILGTPMPKMSDDIMPIVTAALRFHKEWVTEVVATELVVANPKDGWAGTLDLIVALKGDAPGVLTLADYKSGKGYYTETAMQLAAYRRATHAWAKDGTLFELPKTEKAVVVHVRPDKYPDTGYRVVPYDTSDEVYDTFLSCLDLTRRWTLKDENRLVGEPMKLPTRTEQEMVDSALEAADKLREMGA